MVKIKEILGNNKKITIIVCTFAVIAAGIVVAGNILTDSQENIEMREPISAIGDYALTETTQAEKESITTSEDYLVTTQNKKDIEYLQRYAWVRKIDKKTKMYLVFEPNGYDDDDVVQVHRYLAVVSKDEGKKKNSVRYSDDNYFDVSLEGNQMYLEFTSGFGAGSESDEYSIHKKKKTLKFGEATYKAISTKKLKHSSFSYGEGATLEVNYD